MRKIGKKGKQWIIDRAELVKGALVAGRIEVENNIVVGICEDCGKRKKLDPDHKKKRSLGGGNGAENIDWVCRDCHNLRDNMGDPKNKKIKGKKTDWQNLHECKSCKAKVRLLICNKCGKLSV